MLEHGVYRNGRSEQIVLFAARGPWNDAALKNGSRGVGQVIAELDQDRPWAQISCLYGDSVMPPAVFNNFVEQSKVRKSAGIGALAIVIRDSSINAAIKYQLGKGYEEAKIPYQFFEVLEDAFTWLESLGFKVNEQEIASFFAANTLE